MAGFAWFCLGCGAAMAGCGDNSPAVRVAEPLFVSATEGEVPVKPGKTVVVSFLLTTGAGTPVPGGLINFSAIDDPQVPGSDLAGATLAAASGLTDITGTAMVTVTGGLPTRFRLSARNEHAKDAAETLVDVSEGDEGTLSVLASPVGGSVAASLITSVDVLLFDARSCAGLSLIVPPKPVRPSRTVSVGTATDFAVTNTVSNAAVGQGRDASGMLRAAGCVDVPANTIAAGQIVRVYLPLAELQPSPRGTFALSSHFSLAKRDVTRRLAAPWQDLADCPLDPGQIWLDCALDALGSGPNDPLDCILATTGEGELGNLIMSRRGTTVVGSPCRASTSSVTDGGAQSLDAKIAALFPSPAQPPSTGVASLGAALTTILDDVTVNSTLSLETTSSPNLFEATHTLRTAIFQVGGIPAAVDIVAQGTPASLARFVPVRTAGGVLSVDAHRLGLGLGGLAHVAFSTAVLAAHGWPTATDAYLNQLFGLATTTTTITGTSGTTVTRKTGCDAMDALVCSEIGRDPGCMRQACLAGQAALATRLDAAFALVDGDGADLQLSGSATMIDDDGDGFADRLGASAADSGLWSAQIRAHAGTEILSGSWTGTLQAQ